MSYTRITTAIFAFRTVCRDLEAGSVRRALRRAKRVPPFDEVVRLVLESSLTAWRPRAARAVQRSRLTVV
jgi:hypothetical protein